MMFALSLLACLHAPPPPAGPPLIATDGRGLVSPDGRYSLIVVHTSTPEGPYRGFLVVEHEADRFSWSPNPVFAPSEMCLERFRWIAQWGEDGSIWEYCADTGLFHWRVDGPASWACFLDGGSSAPAPEPLRSLEPFYFSDDPARVPSGTPCGSFVSGP